MTPDMGPITGIWVLNVVVIPVEKRVENTEKRERGKRVRMFTKETFEQLLDFEDSGIIHAESMESVVRVPLTKKEAIELASALLQWATENKEEK